MPTYASSDGVKVGFKEETVEGTLQTSDAYELLLTSGITTDFTSNIIQDPTISGAGEALDARTNLRGLNLTTPFPLRFADLRLPLAAVMRDTPAAAVTVVATAEIDVLLAGTHNDGTTGPQLQVTGASALTLFDTLIAYGGATLNGAEYLMMNVAGSSSGKEANDGFRRIKEVWKNGSNSFIDIDKAYIGGVATFFGEPMVAATSETITIRVGVALRNRGPGAAGDKSHSFKWNFSDVGKWQAGYGAVPNDLNFSWSGKDGASVEISWIAQAALAMASSDPTSPAAASFVDNNVGNQMLIGAEDLLVCALWTVDPSGTPKPILLSSSFMTQFNYALAGNGAAIEDVSGTSQITGVRRGNHQGSGSLNWYLADGAEELVALGAEGSAKKGGVDVIFKDRLNQHFILGGLLNEFGHTGPSPGSGGSTVSGTLDFTGSRKSKTSRSLVVQEIALP